MEDRPIINESRKKGVAITAILALAAMKPTNNPELIVAGAIAAIAIVAICVQGLLDTQKKEKITTKPEGEQKNETTT